MKILIVNVGSTSLKYKLYDFPSEEVFIVGKIENIQNETSPHSYEISNEPSLEKEPKLGNYENAIKEMLDVILNPEFNLISDIKNLAAIGFKTVHCDNLSTREGAQFLSEEVLEAMERVCDVAPAHNPPYLSAIRAFQNTCPEVPLLGLFEPEFHRTIPEKARTFGVPLEWKTKYGIQKYGFHGASHHYISKRVQEILGNNKLKVISCHLGGSSSVCALKNGVSIDTSMEYSPQSGILQSARCETLDPFILLHFQKTLGFSPEEINKILCSESGLKGISGISGDIPELEKAADSGNERAKLALEVYVYQIRKALGTMAAALNGVDVITFTGGIGERGKTIRKSICQGLTYLGAEIDLKANEKAFGIEMKISMENSKTQLWVLPTNEELVVARAISKKLGE